MVLARVLAGVVASILLTSHVESQEAKASKATKVTQAELLKAPRTYQDQFVQVEGVVRDVAAPVEAKGTFRCMLHLESKVLSIVYSGKPTVVKGDRVLVTGKFTHTEAFSFLPNLIYVHEDVGGKVEKVAPKRP